MKLPKINVIDRDIGVDICENCPYDDCISTYDNMCQLMQDEIYKVKQKAYKDELVRRLIALQEVEKLMNGKPMALKDIRLQSTIKYSLLQTLYRNKNLVGESVKKPGKHPAVMIYRIDYQGTTITEDERLNVCLEKIKEIITQKGPLSMINIARQIDIPYSYIKSLFRRGFFDTQKRIELVTNQPKNVLYILRVKKND